MMVRMNTQMEDISTPSEHAFLDRACDYLQNGEIDRAEEMLVKTLLRIKRHLNSREWELYLSRVCLCHPVHGMIHNNRRTGKVLRHSQGEQEQTDRENCECHQRRETVLPGRFAGNLCVLCHINHLWPA